MSKLRSYTLLLPRLLGSSAFRRRAAFLAALAAASWGRTPGAIAQSESPAPAREYWLLSNTEVVVASEPTFAVRGRVEVGANAESLMVSADRELVALASAGAIKKKGLFGGLEDWPEPGSKSTVSLIRRASLEVVARDEVAFRPSVVGFTKDGRTLLVLSYGQVHKDPKKHLAPHVYALDTATGKILHDSVLESEPKDRWFVEDSGRVLLALEGHEKRLDAPPELVVFDGRSGSLTRTKLRSAPVKWRLTGVDSLRYLELEKEVLVVDSEGRLQGEPIQAGEEKLFLLDSPEGDRSFLAGKTKKAGRLLVLEAGKVVKNLDGSPLQDVFFDRKGGRLILCGSKQGQLVDAKDLSVQRTFPLPDAFRDVHVNPAGDRLYINEVGDDVSVVEIESGRQVARFTSGRGGKKFLLAALAGLASGLSPYRYGLTMRMPAENYSVPTAVQSLAFAPSGRFVYVHNSTTADITIVETQGHTSLLKIGTGATAYGPFLWTLPGAQQLISVGLNKLMAFDTEKGSLSYEHEFPKSWLSYLPDLGLVQVRGKQSLELWRPWPLEKATAFEPPDANILVRPKEHRVFVFSEKGTQVYDSDLKRLGQVPTTGETLNVYVIESPAASGGEEAGRS